MTETTQEAGPAQASGSLLGALPTGRLVEAGQRLLAAATERAVEMALDRVDDLSERLTEVADNGGVGMRSAIGGGLALARGENPVGGVLKAGASALKDKVTGAVGLGGSSSGSSGSGGSGGSGARGTFKFMNITESMDVGVPIRTVYDQWTQFSEFPSFMKKVESVEQTSDEKSTWKAQVFWSHRSWETTIREQVPDSHILWVSTGAKGHADGCVSFHELAPNMTRVLLVLEYYPRGLFEKTGNIWRAVGRRARLEFKHFCRHVTMDSLLERDDVEGWRGEIRDSEVVTTHEEALAREREADDEYGDDEYADGESPYADDADEEVTDEDVTDEDVTDEDDEPDDAVATRSRRVPAGARG